MDIYTPYTYIIKFIPTGQVYYGVSYANNRTKISHPSQLWTTYFTSSKVIKQLITEYGTNAFDYQIRKTFDSKDKAVLWENKVLNKFDAKNNPKWLNQTNNDKNFIFKAHTDESKLKLSLAHKGKKLTPDWIQKVAQANTGKKRTPEQKANMSAGQMGIKRGPLSDAHKQKLSSILTGRTLSEEHKQKIAIANTGKIGVFTGRTHTAETKQKMSENMKGPRGLQKRIDVCPYCQIHNVTHRHIKFCQLKSYS